MIPLKLSAFEANAKGRVIIIHFLVEFLDSDELGVTIFQELCREQCGKVHRRKETTNLENDLKAM